MPISNNILDRDKAAYKENETDGGLDRRVTDVTTQGKLDEVINLLEDNALVFSKSTVVIPASTMVVVDTNLISSFSRLDYILNFKDSPVTVTKSLRLAVQNNGGSITDTVSERLGGTIDVLIDVTDDTVDTFLEITNNEAFALTMTFLKSKI